MLETVYVERDRPISLASTDSRFGYVSGRNRWVWEDGTVHYGQIVYDISGGTYEPLLPIIPSSSPYDTPPIRIADVSHNDRADGWVQLGLFKHNNHSGFYALVSTFVAYPDWNPR